MNCFLPLRLVANRAAARASSLRVPATVLAGCLLLVGAGQAQSPRMLVSSEHEAAVAQARAGDAAGALSIMRRLLRLDPNNPRLLADTAIIASWAGQDSYVLELYADSSTLHNDLDVVSAAARAARNLHHYDQALALYRRAATLGPERWQAVLGEAMVLTDKGENAQARALMRPLLQDHARDPGVEAGEAYLCMREGHYACVIAEDQGRTAQMPHDAAAVQGEMALALASLGANGLAVEDWHGADPDEGLRLKADLGAERIRWAEADQNWEEQKADASAALALLDPVIAGTKPGDPLWTQAQADRLLALSDLNRQREVVRSFERLRRAEVDVPAYALMRVADSYLAVQKPKRAEALYRSLAKRMVSNHDVWSGLAYAQFEQGNTGAAYATIARAWSDAPQMLQAKGLKVPQMNRWYTDFGLQAAQMRGYSGLLSQEQKQLSALLAAAPANPDLNRALAMNYLNRGWPARAARQERIADSFQQPDELPVLADAEVLEQGGRRDAADALLRPLLAREGSDAPMIRYMKDRAAEHGWQTELHGGFELSSGRFVGTNQTSEAHLYSPLLDNRWRMYLHGWGDHGQFQAGETWRSRGALGMSFDYARQHAWAEAGADQNPAGARPGIAAGTDLSFGDRWTVGLQGDTDDLSQVQLIASIANIHARSGTISLQWRASDLASVRGGYTRVLFTDGNQRTIVSSSWDQRIWTTAHLQADLTPQLWTSWNSRDESRIYYNPRHDLLAGAATTLRWVTWRRYERSFAQQLTVSGAPYWQQNYGTGYAISSSYQQNWVFSRRFGAFSNVTWNSQPYDGNNEPYTNVTFGISWGNQ